MNRLRKLAAGEVTRKDIKEALEAAGYGHNEPTEENLIECFKDYIDGGQFSNIDIDEVDELIADGEITLKQICDNLKRV